MTSSSRFFASPWSRLYKNVYTYNLIKITKDLPSNCQYTWTEIDINRCY